MALDKCEASAEGRPEPACTWQAGAARGGAVAPGSASLLRFGPGPVLCRECCAEVVFALAVRLANLCTTLALRPSAGGSRAGRRGARRLTRCRGVPGAYRNHRNTQPSSFSPIGMLLIAFLFFLASLNACLAVLVLASTSAAQTRSSLRRSAHLQRCFRPLTPLW